MVIRNVKKKRVNVGSVLPDVQILANIDIMGNTASRNTASRNNWPIEYNANSKKVGTLCKT